MKTLAVTPELTEAITTQERTSRVPLLVKVAYTAFMAVLIPVYLRNYGPTNFLYFCDVALLLTLIGVWRESPLLISMAAVGILLPQAFWVVDFAVRFTGHSFTGMTDYMFDPNRSRFLRGLSFFHGWLPFLLAYLVRRLGYERRALPAWTAVAWVLCLISYFYMPPIGAQLADPKIPVNINYVFGFSDTTPQHWMAPAAFLATWMAGLFAVVYLPTHFVLRKFAKPVAGE